MKKIHKFESAYPRSLDVCALNFSELFLKFVRSQHRSISQASAISTLGHLGRATAIHFPQKLCLGENWQKIF